MKFLRRLLWAFLILLIVAGAAMLIPAIRDRVLWRVDEWRIRIQYALRPPEKEVFVPQLDEQLQATLTAMAAVTATPTVEPTSTSTLAPEEATLTPTLMPTPLPAQAQVEGVPYVDQHGLWNYCAPANLAMALGFWGWEGERTDIGGWVKPFEKDKNVMPYELADYVQSQTDLNVVVRSGGTMEMLKSFIASGFPVLIEKGAFLKDISGKVSWMGHYAVVTGYDDAKQEFKTQDSFYEANYPVSYEVLESGWRAFNFVFLVVHPADQEAAVLNLLGPLAEPDRAYDQALQTASNEIYTTGGNDQFFAWFNRGTNLVALYDFLGAAASFDEAFKVYASLPEAQRPWRMVWYQTSPYFAYYYSGRYGDVVSLASQTIENASEPYIEESFYWRAKARIALGDQGGAIEDLRTSLEYHPNFTPSVDELASLGQTP